MDITLRIAAYTLLIFYFILIILINKRAGKIEIKKYSEVFAKDKPRNLAAALFAGISFIIPVPVLAILLFSASITFLIYKNLRQHREMVLLSFSNKYTSGLRNSSFLLFFALVMLFLSTSLVSTHGT